MKKSLYKYLLCFLFLSSSSVAVGLSNDEKRVFIESLAKPSSKTRVFYRWQPEDVRKKLLEAGEMTPELYEDYVGGEPETGTVHLVGQGLYVAEDMSSSSNYGETIVKVVVEQGYPFVDLNDEKVKRQLQKKGISLEEAYQLKPRVAVRDYGRDRWWCLKRRQGIKFMPVSNKELMENFKKAHLSIGEDRKNRFFSLLSKQEQKQLIDGIENIFDGLDILFVAARYFSEMEMTEIVDAIIPHVKDIKEGVLCLNVGWDSLSKEDKGKIMDKILSYIKTEEDMEALHREIKKQFVFKDYNEVFTEFQAVLQQKAEQVKGSDSILPDFSKTFSEEELREITSEGRNRSSEKGSGSILPDFSKRLSEEELREITDEKRDKSSENRLEGTQNYSLPPSQNRAGSDGSQNRPEKSHERKLREAIQESITSGKDIGGAVHEYVLESIRCSSDLWKSN